MTAAGWHPDPHGRAERRYHDGARWTEHVADAEGATSVDPQGGAATPESPVIGPPPPRRPPPGTEPEEDAADPPAADHTQPLSPADLAAAMPLPPADEPVADEPPAAAARPAPADADHTQQLSPADLAAATSPNLAKPAPVDHTVQMSAEEIAAAAALARSAPPAPGATGARHTEPLSPEDIAAAAALAAQAPSPPPPSAVDRPRARASVVGIVLALLGVAVGLAALFVLPWADGPGPEVSFLDLREVVDRSGPDIGTVLNAYVLTGAIFALGVGGVVALARAIGAGALRAIGATVVVLGVGGLAVLGYVAIDTDQAAPGSAATTDVGPDAGAPVTLPDGTPVTDPTSGAPVTVPADGAGVSGLTEDDIAGALLVQGEDRLTDAAAVGAGVMVAAGLLMLVGLLLRGRAGHIVAALGLLVAAGWSAAAVMALRDQAALGDVGLGAYALVLGTVLLTAGAAVPGRSRPAPSPVDDDS